MGARPAFEDGIVEETGKEENNLLTDADLDFWTPTPTPLKGTPRHVVGQAIVR